MIDRSRVVDVYPASPSQAGLLFESLRAGGEPRHLEQYAYLLRGPLDAGRLRSAFEAVVARHEVLRSALKWEKVDSPLQIVLRDVELPWAEIDLLALSPDDRERRVDAFLRERRLEGIDPRRPPPIDFSLLRVDRDAWWLVVGFHHTMLDGWGYTQLLHEAIATYDAGGAAPASLAAPQPYSKYIAWLKARDPERDLAFWRERLRDVSGPTPLGVDVTRSVPDGEPRFAELHEDVPEPLARRIAEFCRAERVSEAAVTVGGWALLMARYAGQRDVVVGATMSGRPEGLSGANEMVGMFVGTPPLRIRVPDRIGVVDWLRRVHDEVLAVREHQYASLPDIRRQSAVPPGEPLYESTVLHQSVPFVKDGSDFGRDLVVERKKSFRSPGFPLGLMALRDGEALAFVLQYDRGRVPDAIAQRVPRGWMTVIEQLVAGPDTPLGLVGPMSSSDARALVDLGVGAAPSPTPSLVPDLVCAHAASRPDAVALRHGDEVVSYAELERRSAAVAAGLRDRGVSLESCVAIWSDRRVDMVVTALGIMRAGASYLPIDGGQPSERVASMLADADARIIVTDEPRATDLAATVLRFGELEAGGQPKRPSVELSVDNVAYVIFTSGSTGRPKGVAVRHGGFANTIEWRLKVSGLGPGDHGSHLVDTSFDAAVVETWEVLASGATLHIADDDVRADASRLAEWFRSEGITSAHVIPALLRQMLEQRPECFEATRLLSVGGEQMRWEGFHRAPFTLFNQYGPTECSITALHAVVDPDRADETIPVGRSVDGGRSYVLDDALEVAPFGVVGELVLGGAGVSRGYVGAPARTAEKFVPDPHAADPGGRMYRTGDLVRWRGDEQLEFVGRDDQQVKLRGRRVELGEIEDACHRHEGVHEAAAHIAPDGRGVKQLVVYVVPNGALEWSDLRAHLAEQLPAHMIPNQHVSMDGLPRTQFGKVDKKSLPTPKAPVRAARAERPSDPREARVATAFAEALGLTEVGPEDDFFALGGDSIIAMQVVWRIKRAGLRVSVQDIFEAPVVRALASRASEGDEGVVGLAYAGATGDVPLTPIQRWFFELENPRPSRFQQLLRMQLERRVDESTLRESLETLVEHHEMLRARYVEDADGVVRQTVEPFEPSLARLRVVRSEVDERSLAEQLEASLSIDVGPVFGALFDAHRGVLWLAAHHLVIDAFSWRVLVEDLEAAVTASVEARRAALPRTSSFAQVAAALGELASRPDIRAEAPHWDLMSRAAVPAVPVDETGSADEDAEPKEGRFRDARSVEVVFPAEDSRRLSEAVDASGLVTIEEALIAALAIGYRRWSGRSAVRLELEGHGRDVELEGVETSRTVGWLTVAHPVRLELPEEDDPALWLTDVRAQLRRVPNGGVGYGLNRHLAERADDAPYPRPQIAFNFLGRATDIVRPGFGRASLNPFGLPVAGDNVRPAMLLVVAYLTDAGLEWVIDYPARVLRAGRVEALAGAIVDALRAVARELEVAQGRRARPLDFPLVELDDATLESLRPGGEIEDVLPLTPLQEGMLFHSRMAAEADASPLYREQFVHAIRGRVDAEALCRALQHLHDRHAALRTEFHWEGLEAPVQLVRTAVPVELPCVDLRDEADPEARFEQLRAAEHAEPLRLERAPVSRFTIALLGDGDARLIQTAHHMMLDGWSGGILTRELSALYRAELDGQSLDLPPVRPFGDYVRWLARQDAAPARRHFSEALGDVTRPTPLSLEPTRPVSAASADHRRIRRALQPDLARRLHAAARREGLTLATFLAAAWSLTLSWRSGDDRPIFGVTMSGRPDGLDGAQGMMGLFINTLPLRVEVTPSARVRDWLRDVQSSLLALRRHEHLPLVEAERCSGMGAGPIFQSLLVVENHPTGAGDAGPAEMAPVHNESRVNYPLVIAAHFGAALSLEALFHPQRVDGDACEQVLGELERVLDQLVAASASDSVADVSPLGFLGGPALGAELRGRARALDLGVSLDLPPEDAGARPRPVAVPEVDARVALAATLRIAAIHATGTDAVVGVVRAGAWIPVRARHVRRATGRELLDVADESMSGGDARPIPWRWLASRTGERARSIVVAATEADRDVVRALGPRLAVSIDERARSAELDFGDGVTDATAARVAARFEACARGIVERPDVPTDRAPSLPDEERALIAEWSTPTEAQPESCCAHELFEAAVARTPDAIAVARGTVHRRYRELAADVWRVAHALRARGVGPERRVAILLPRDVDYVVCALAVLEAGGAYVPIDPDYPAERVRYILADCGADLVLTHLEGGDRRFLDPSTLGLDEAARGGPPAALVRPSNAAYVIYTSGTTGRPKGVVLTHATAVALVRSMSHELGLGPDSRLLQFAALGFDATVQEIFPTLAAGARLVLPERAEQLSGERLAELIASQGVTVATFPPSVQATLPADDRLASLATLVSAGEACSVAQLRRLGAGRRFINAYGPTENTVCATLHVCAPDDTQAPIGRPLANVRARTVAAMGETLGVGDAGEIALGGAQLARGYVRQPRLTAERFVPDPAGQPGDRMYLTGDLGRWLTSGALAYLGRIDRQVKLRGFRIEPAEIEAVLESSPRVQQAVVVVRGEGDARRLVAYVVADGALDLDRERARASEVLPGYMMPSDIVRLDALPLTPNGKVDHARLPSPSRRGGEAPGTPTEIMLAEAWVSLLGVDAVHRDDDFFRLGGNSLLVTRLVSWLRKRADVELPLTVAFEARTLREMSLRIDEASAAALPPIERAPREGPLPASHAQARLWLLDRILPDSAAYHVPVALRLRGTPDPRKVQRAIDIVVSRHEALRTSLVEIDGRPFQRILEGVRVPLEVSRLEEVGAEAREAALAALVAQDAAAPFDLEEAPLMRARLVLLSPDESAFVCVMHHAISDGWSVDVLLRELDAAYSADAAGMPTLPVQYADYAVWQRAWLEGGEMERQLAYWRRHLRDAPATLDIPTDSPRRTVKGVRGGSVGLSLSPAVGRRVSELASERGVTPFMVLLTAWQVLLSRYARTEDVVVGSPIAGRRVSELEPLIGFFANTLVLRANFSGAPSFQEALERARATLLEAYGNQDVPFERLVSELSPRRDTSVTPLFQSMFSLDSSVGSERSLFGGEASALRGEIAYEKFDVSLQLARTPDSYTGALSYDADLFAASSMRRLAAQFGAFLETLLDSPDRPLPELRLLPETEAEELRAWNDTARSYGAPTTLPALLRRRVDAQPLAIALKSEVEGELTFASFEARVNGVAAALRARGARPGAVVGVCLERSFDLLVAVHGVVAAGCAYVPLDPTLPAERLSYMASDCGAAVVLVHESTEGRLPDGQLTRVRVDELGDGARAPLSCLPRDAAYMIYTSGSTGRPKGATNTHEGIVNRLHWMQEAFPIGPGDVLVHKTPYSFDVSVWELFWPLHAGATLVVAEPEGHKDPVYLARLFREAGVSTAHFVPSMLESFLFHLEDEGGAPPSLRRIVCSGEALSRELVERTHSLAPKVAVENLYGPTEAAVDVSHWRCVPGDPSARVPIGAPIANTRLRVVSGAQLTQPIGVPGELCIGGVQVSRGYHARPALTADRFRPDDEGAPGDRLYRTGDLCRWRSDGQLDYLGRLDHQVKLRGFRIELGEVEVAMESVPGVRRAVAAVRGSGLEQRLVGYLLGDASAETVRAALENELPEYMVPAALVTLTELPLTPSGKVDRKTLPEPEWESAVYEPPSTPTEVELAEVWTALLDVARVGRNDDFFALGGHSLLATRMIARARERFGVEVELRSVFASPRLSALAKVVEGAARRALPTLTRVETAGVVPASFAQERLWFLQRLDPDSAAYNIPEAFTLVGELDRGALLRALDQLFERHEVLRTRFVEREGAPLQSVESEVRAAYSELAAEGATLEARREDARRQAEAFARRPFDLARAPLARALLIEIAPAEHVFVLVIHHIAGDGWSNGVVSRDLTELYRAEIEEREPLLPVLPVQYRDYAAWQRSWLLGDALDAQLAYWRERLDGAPPVLELPLDRPRPAIKRSPADAIRFSMPPTTSAAVHRLARQLGGSPFTVLLSAWAVLLARYSRTDDFVIGTPVAGRRAAELEELVGFFVNTLVLRMKVGEAFDFESLVRSTTDTLLEAQAHQDVPFEKLVAELGVEREASTPPLFQVMFSLHRDEGRTGELLGVVAERLEVAPAEAKFDLSLMLVQKGDSLIGRLEYDAALFEPQTAQRHVTHFLRVLDRVLEAPREELARRSFLDEAEHARLTTSWANGPELPCDPRTVPALVEARAGESPDAVALVSGDVRTTYRALIDRVDRVAGGLVSRGVGPGRRVAVCLPPGQDFVCAALAVMRSGAAYVSIDPSYPDDRIAYMVEDSDAALVVADPPARARLTAVAAPIVELDALSAAAGSARRPTARDEAYVIYTSGTTGRPKGVAVAHEQLSSLCAWHRDVYPVGPGVTVTQLAGVGFDASVWEIWPALAAGATVSIVLGDARRDPSALADHLAEAGVEIAFMATPLAEAMLSSEASTPPRLKTLLTGGDRLHRVDVSALPFELVNHYGPTENTVVSTYGLVRTGVEPTLGRPLPGTSALVLDGALEPTLEGVPGELCVGGRQVARGYVCRPSLTADRFRPDPFGDPGERIYRTGDLVRWTQDAELAFLGRIDRQVKLRGQRVELGEIESVLESEPRVRAAVVEVRRNARGVERLVAYVVGENGDLGGLERLAAERLPGHMVPNQFVSLSALPLTPNGKIDRAALPEPAWAATADGEAPRTESERWLAALWQDLLGIDVDLKREDDFFALGGHSLVATRVASRVREELGVELSLRSVFEGPTLAAMASRIDEAQRRDLPPITPRDASSREVPTSFAQERLWFLQQLRPESASYNIPLVLRLRGRLALTSLSRALNAIVERHEILRTRIVGRDGAPVQVVDPPSPLALALERVDGESSARRRVGAIVGRPFDLAAESPIRAHLLEGPQEERWLVIVLHHVAGDGWSSGVVLSELAALYRAELEGREAEVAPLEIQYADYALWQRRWLVGDELDRQLSYWRAQLAGAPPSLELPIDHPRPHLKGERGGVVRLRATGSAARRARELAREGGATSFMVLLAAWQLLLARYARTDDVCVGTPIAGRRVAELEPLVGFFVNTLVLRGRVRPELTFRQLIAQVRETTLDAYAHQDVPFERLVAALAPSRDTRHTPLFQVMFSLQSGAPATPGMPGLDAQLVSPDEVTCKFDLSLTLVDDGSALAGMLAFDASLFEPQSVEGMARRFEDLLDRVMSDPDRPLGQVPLLARDQTAPRHAAPPPIDARPVDALIGRWALDTPDALALCAGDETLSYAELWRGAGAVAGALRERGVGHEDRVALLATRTIDTVVAMVGVMRAGAAYVALDPEHPQERLAHQLTDSGAVLLLGGAHELDALTLSAPIPTATFADCRDGSQDLDLRRHATGLLYVTYTSGSTGTPKGVAVEHAGMRRYLTGLGSKLALAPGKSHAVLTTLSADVGNTAVYGALTSGGVLHLLTPEVAKSPRRLASYLERRSVDFLKTVPPHMEALLSTAEGVLPREAVVLGGETFPWSLANSIGDRCEAFNSYGPSETTVAVAMERVSRPGGASVPIGAPIGGARLLVVDPLTDEVPSGVPGELWIAGPSVSRGYLGRPRLTAERFVPDPSGVSPGARAYRTGDHVRSLPDGRLEFLGRADGQVKIRGYRVELGEVEAQVRAIRGVRSAVVLARRDDERGLHLVAYVVGSATDDRRLAADLGARLPEHMIPSAWVHLDSLPLTENGKIDRRALPAPSWDTGPTEPPVTATEVALARIWSRILGVSSVGRHADFFALGGHSLLAVKLVAELEDGLARRVDLLDVFERRTVARMAELLDADAGSRADSTRVVTLSRGPAPTVFALHSLAGTVGHFVELADRLEGRATMLGLAHSRMSDEGSLETLAQRYAAVVRARSEGDAVHLLAHSAGSFFALAAARVLSAEGCDVRLFLLDPPPLTGPVGALTDEIVRLKWARELLAMASGERPDALADGASRETVFAALASAGIGSTDSERALLERQLDAYAAALRLSREGSSTAAPGVRAMTLFASEGNGLGGTDAAAAGWRLALPTLEVATLEASHFGMLRGPDAGRVVESIERWLEASRETRKDGR